MALTYSNVRQGRENNQRYVEADVTFDSSYPTGGEAIDHAALGITDVRQAHVVHGIFPDYNTSAYTTHGRQVVPVLTSPTAVKLKVYTAADTEAGSTSDQSEIVTRVRFIGY